MEKSGITRRIDSLGRIVIPKEIRKNLRISDSDEMSISLINNEIILSKCDSMEKNRVFSSLIYSLSHELNKNVLLTSKDKIIDMSLIKKNDYQDIRLSQYAIDLIKKRKSITNNLDSVNLFNKNEVLAYILHPLVINGDLLGSLIIFDDVDFTKEEILITSFIKKFLENYLE